MSTKTTYIVESWRPDSSDGGSRVSTRIMRRDWNPTTTDHEWCYKRHTFDEWDWELDAKENHRRAVVRTVRMDVQQDPIDMTYAGDTVRGSLWVVLVTG